jgi:hypothetical protein
MHRWNHRWSIDITDELIDIIDNSAGLPTDWFLHIIVYLEDGISPFSGGSCRFERISRSLLLFRKELLPFQQAAVLIAAKKLNTNEKVFSLAMWLVSVKRSLHVPWQNFLKKNFTFQL